MGRAGWREGTCHFLGVSMPSVLGSLWLRSAACARQDNQRCRKIWKSRLKAAELPLKSSGGSRPSFASASSPWLKDAGDAVGGNRTFSGWSLSWGVRNGKTTSLKRATAHQKNGLPFWTGRWPAPQGRAMRSQPPIRLQTRNRLAWSLRLVATIEPNCCKFCFIAAV